MNMETRMGQSLGVNQQLSLAPQLLQWLKILQLPINELHAAVQQELELNPSLEIDETPVDISGDTIPDDAPEAAAGSDDPDLMQFDDNTLGEKYELMAEMDADWAADTAASGPVKADADRDEKRQFMLDSITAEPSLQEHLLGQLANMRLTDQSKSLAVLVIGSLDRRGYLSGSEEELVAMCGGDRQAYETTLRLVQSFDPAGIGARDLRECLLLQMEQRTSVAARVVDEYLDALGRGQYREIAAELDVEEEDVIEALGYIRTLDPEPGRRFQQERARYIKPDVTIHKTADGYHIELNDSGLPRLRVSQYCRDILAQGKLDRGDAGYLRKKIRASSFLIQGIRQRQDTLRKVALAILHYQREYFDQPDGILKPLTMARVAADINVHETTVSRAVANKYIRTPRGLFEMRHFFPAGYQCADGSAVVSMEVKDMIVQLVENEPPAHPLTDIEIAARMREQGVELARRTVAKYREELGIASSKERQHHMRRPPIKLAEPSAAAVDDAGRRRALMLA